MALPARGARVSVPLGSRVVTGCVVDLAVDEPDTAAIRDIAHVIDDRPFLPPLVVDLALWVGTYYASGPGDALAIAMPPTARHGRATSFRTVQRAALEPAANTAVPKGAKQ